MVLGGFRSFHVLVTTSNSKRNHFDSMLNLFSFKMTLVITNMLIKTCLSLEGNLPISSLNIILIKHL